MVVELTSKRSGWCPGIGTEAIVRLPDRHPEVSKGHSTPSYREKAKRVVLAQSKYTPAEAE